MVFIFQPSSSGGERRATSFGGQTTFGGSFPALESPELQITYTKHSSGDASNENRLIGLRFQEVAIPKEQPLPVQCLNFLHQR